MSGSQTTNWTAEWKLREKEQKLLATIVNKNRQTWTQLNNYYKKPPSKLKGRIQGLAAKLQDASEYAGQYDGEDVGALDEADRERVLAACQYQVIWDTSVEAVSQSLDTEYDEIYGDDR